MPTTFTVLPIGNVATDVDPDESNFDAENTAPLVGLTFGSATNPLSGSQDDFATLTPGNFNAIDQSSIGGNDGSGVYNQSNIGGGEYYFIDGVQETHDSTFSLRATVTYVDGTVLTDQRIVLFQSTNGNLYITPNFSTTPLIEAGPIESIEFTNTNSGLTGGLVADQPVWDLSNICFTRGTVIRTRLGEVAVEDLTVGDEVLTMDSGYQPIRWIGARILDKSAIAAKPKLKPIRIRAGALGHNLPEKDLIVSPQHRVLLRNKVVARMFDSAEILIPACKLLALPGVDIDWGAEEVEYYHFLFDKHQIVWANGAPAESLFTGPEALKAVAPEAREEIATLFPEILQPDFVARPARMIPEKGKLMKTLAKRIAKNNKCPIDTNG